MRTLKGFICMVSGLLVLLAILCNGDQFDRSKTGDGYSETVLAGRQFDDGISRPVETHDLYSAVQPSTNSDSR